jgi:hypothetical protein
VDFAQLNSQLNKNTVALNVIRIAQKTRHFGQMGNGVDRDSGGANHEMP